MKRSNATTYNAISILFVGLTVFAFLCTLLMLVRVLPAPPFLSPRISANPTTAAYPTETITPTPSNTPIPSATPIPPTETPLPPTKTPLPTETPLPPTPLPPSATPIPPTPVTPSPIPPTNTPEPPTKIPPTQPPTRPGTRATATRTGVRSPTPPASRATATLFPTARISNAAFVLTEAPIEIPNPDALSPFRCDYQGVAGIVTDLAGQKLKVKQFKVIISFPDKTEQTAQINPLNDQFYEAGSWALKVADKPNKLVYGIQLVNSQNRPISDKIEVKFSGTCDTNVILVNFKQTKPVELP